MFFPDRTGKTYFITGGACGLGLACAKRLVMHKANVVIADKNQEEGKKVEAELGRQCLFVMVDCTDRASVAAGIRVAVEHFKSLSGIINCAGILPPAFTTIDKHGRPCSTEKFLDVIKVNLFGTFYGSSEGAAEMVKLPVNEHGQRGVIINVASAAAFEGQRGVLAYAASKGAIVGMTLPMARDLSKYGIRIVTIAPGPMETPMFKMLAPKVREGHLAAMAGPKRLGDPKEFAMLVEHIIDNGYLNGETIRLDAGIRLPNL